MTLGRPSSHRRGMWSAQRTHTPCGGSRTARVTASPRPASQKARITASPRRGLWTAARTPSTGRGSVPHRGTRHRRVGLRAVAGLRLSRDGGAVAVVAGCLLLVGCQGVAGEPHPEKAAPTRRTVGRVAAGRPVSIAIAAVGVDARVVPVGLRADGTMEVPAVDLAGWYEPGPRPGEAGPAVIVGHVDSRRGPAVFYRLGELRPGDRIVVGLQGGGARPFLVERVERRPQDGPPDPAHLESHPPAGAAPDHLRGSFDRSTGHYRGQRHRLRQGR